MVIDVVCKEECAGLDGALSCTYDGKRNPYPGSTRLRFEIDDDGAAPWKSKRLLLGTGTQFAQPKVGREAKGKASLSHLVEAEVKSAKL